MRPKYFILPLFILLTISAPEILRAEAITLTVPTEYTSIQAALDAAADLAAQNTANSYSVLVEPGTYSGSITLKSNIPLRGRETARTILSGGGSGTVVTVNNVTGVSLRNFTIINASIGVSVTGNASTVSITNNVFQVGTGGTAIQVQNSPSAEIINNTFYQNGTAVTRDADTVKIINNIFSSNTTGINQGVVSTENNISYNGFFSNSTNGPKGSNFIPNETVTGTDPLFVDPSRFDFHLRQCSDQNNCANTLSPCIDNGDTTRTDVIDGSVISDIGAYGGSDADSIPFLVQGLSASATSETAISLSWSPNNSYLVTNTDTTKQGGYNVYYSLNKSGAPYDSTVSQIASSPTTTTLTGLTVSTTTPNVPVLNQPSPRDGILILTWPAAANATGYKVHWGINSTDENTVDEITTTSYTLSGLTNGQMYKIAVSAYSQATYYIAVTAYDSVPDVTRVPGEQHESAYSTEASVGIGPKLESANSNEVTDFPEPLVPYPQLRNEGCFIATAAYGYYSAPQVQALREFRDRYLLTTAPGRAFVRWYYAHSPSLAGFINAHPELKPAVRFALAPAVAGAIFMTRTSLLLKIIVLAILVLMSAVIAQKSLSHTKPRRNTK